MWNSSTVTCDNIEKKLKLFLDDLLTEEEYQDFLGHLEACSKCKKYVDSVDSFSNQLWKLGDVKVPSDFCATVLFKLTQAEEKSQESKYVISKKMVGAGLVVVLVVAVLFFGTNYFKLRQPSSKNKEIVPAPIVTVEVKQKPSDDLEAEVLFNHLKGMAASLGVLEQEGASDESPEEVLVQADDEVVLSGTEKPPALDESGNEKEPVLLKPTLLHWHFLRTSTVKDIGVLRLKRQARKAKSELQEGVNERKRIEAEIKYMEKEKREVDYELLSASGSEKLKLDEDKARIEFELKQRYALKRQQEDAVKSLEDKNRQAESKIEQILKEKSRGENEPMHTLGTLGIKPDYQDRDSLLFTVTGEKLKIIRRQLSITPQAGSFLQDFTPVDHGSADREYRVSIYIEKKESLARHWHVSLALPEQKSQLLNAIREKEGVINYEFEEEVVFSIPNLKSELLKAEMAAMRIGVVEFGYPKHEDEKLVSKPVIVSVYFLK